MHPFAASKEALFHGLYNKLSQRSTRGGPASPHTTNERRGASAVPTVQFTMVDDGRYCGQNLSLFNAGNARLCVIDAVRNREAEITYSRTVIMGLLREDRCIFVSVWENVLV
jgi:hypothetical protein